MSDGPHRSLPLGKAWKKFAKWADNFNFDTAQNAELAIQVLMQDFRRQVPNRAIDLLKKESDDRERDLFPDHRMQKLADIGQMMNGSPLGRLVFDCVDQEFAAGGAGQKSLANALNAAVSDWMQRRARQIEEHYQRHRDSTMRRAATVRKRIEKAFQSISIADVAHQILRPEPHRANRVRLRSGLDDGVPRQ